MAKTDDECSDLWEDIYRIIVKLEKATKHLPYHERRPIHDILLELNDVTKKLIPEIEAFD